MKNLVIAAVAAAVASQASMALAADLIIDEPVVPVVEVSSGNWDGPFIGILGGYGWADYEDSDATEMDLSGWLAGVALGANFTLTDGVVAGLVGDIAWSDIASEDLGGYTAAIDWTASLRGRIGLDAGAFLPYVTAGLAVAGASVDDPANGTDSATHFGWTAGAGVEFAATEQVSIDLQYRYSDYGTQTYDVGAGGYDVSLTSHQVTAGLNWSF